MKRRLEGLLQHALNRAKKGGALKLESLPPLFFEVPRDPAFGDLASTVALGLARAERKAPRAIAETIVAHLEDPEGSSPASISPVPAISTSASRRASGDLPRRCRAAGLRPAGAGRRPARAGRVRQRQSHRAAARRPWPRRRARRRRGAPAEGGRYEVTREYYVNDTGKQIATLARSAWARLLKRGASRTRSCPRTAIPATTCAS